VSNPVTREDLVARTWGVFWYLSKIPVLFEIMVQIKPKRGTGVKTPSPRSFWCGMYVSWRSCNDTLCVTHMTCSRTHIYVEHMCVCVCHGAHTITHCVSVTHTTESRHEVRVCVWGCECECVCVCVSLAYVPRSNNGVIPKICLLRG